MKKLLSLFFAVSSLFLTTGCYSSITLKREITSPEENSGTIVEPDSLRVITILETNGNFFRNSLDFHKGYLFAAEFSGRIYAFEQDTFEENGYASTRNTTIVSAPVFRGNQMYYLYKKKQNPAFQFVKYDLLKGKEEFDKKLPAIGNGALFDADGLMVVVADNGVFFLDSSATLIKQLEIKGNISTAVLQFPGNIVAGLTTGEICEISTTSKEINYFDCGTKDVVTSFYPVGDNYIVGFESGGIKLAGREGYEFWSVKTAKIEAVPLISGGEVIVGDLAGGIYRISLKTGEIRGSFDSGGMIDLKAFATKSRIIIAAADGRIILLDKEKMKPLQEIQTGGRIRTEILHSDGLLFIGCDNGKILVLQI
ncbi:MAG: hypothetical protein LCH52_03560 [Bacteroidetes bacterium]|nr:hypothetical protein [Bacteroidota bacterium]